MPKKRYPKRDPKTGRFVSSVKKGRRRRK